MIIDHDSYVRFITSDLLYTYTLFGQQLGVNKYETLGGGNGLAMDLAGNYLIVDRDLPGVRVYSPCGDLITIIQYEEFKLIVDVEIGNDGTIIVTDVENDKIYMFWRTQLVCSLSNHNNNGADKQYNYECDVHV